MTLEFFMLMIPPTVTHQEKKVSVVEKNGKAIPKVYEPEDLKAARAKLLDNLARYRPERKLEGSVQLAVKWCFPLDKAGKHHDGEYRTSKPDTDNLQKLLKDCMTAVGFWKDDAQVCSEIVEKFWARVPGIYIWATEM